MTETTTPTLDAVRELLAAHDQTHLLATADDLDPAARDELLRQIASFDFAALAPHLRGEAVASEPIDPATIAPPPVFALDDDRWDRAAMRAAGEDRLRRGTVAAFTVAGGQGTRLGWAGPKGTFPATPITGKPLFRCFAEQIRAAEQKYGVTIPWYIMTSPINDQATRSFFLDNNCFGLRRSDIFMFPQGVAPSFDPETGRILLADPATVAVNPDGHGGSIRALATSGALADMHARGIEHISYFQVDNPLVSVIDPVFIGVHADHPDSSGEMTSKMVRKTRADEKVGVFVSRNDRTEVIEYSDLPETLAAETNADGSLRLDAGSIAIHLLSVAFVESLTDGGSFALPFHRATKKVPYYDLEARQTIEPEAPNAIKLETFVFDALTFAERSVVLETRREDEFAPIKNADGHDSPATSHQLQSDRAGRWLAAAGVAIPMTDDGHADAVLEINPLTALDADDLRGATLPEVIEPGEERVI